MPVYVILRYESEMSSFAMVFFSLKFYYNALFNQSVAFFGPRFLIVVLRLAIFQTTFLNLKMNYFIAET